MKKHIITSALMIAGLLGINVLPAIAQQITLEEAGVLLNTHCTDEAQLVYGIAGLFGKKGGLTPQQCNNLLHFYQEGMRRRNYRNQNNTQRYGNGLTRQQYQQLRRAEFEAERYRRGEGRLENCLASSDPNCSSNYGY